MILRSRRNTSAQLAEPQVRRRHQLHRRFALTCSVPWSKSRKPCGLARPSFQIWPQAPATASTLTPRECRLTASPVKPSTATTSAPHPARFVLSCGGFLLSVSEGGDVRVKLFCGGTGVLARAALRDFDSQW